MKCSKCNHSPASKFHKVHCCGWSRSQWRASGYAYKSRTTRRTAFAAVSFRKYESSDSQDARLVAQAVQS